MTDMHTEHLLTDQRDADDSKVIQLADRQHPKDWKTFAYTFTWWTAGGGVGGIWMFFGGGADVLRQEWHLYGDFWPNGNFGRKIAEIVIFFLYWLRWLIDYVYITKRRFAWKEVLITGPLFCLFFWWCVFATAYNDKPLYTLDVFGFFFVFGGHAITKVAEFQRKRFKNNPANQGKLYTRGLFSLARHINYTGDVIMFAGWVMVVGTWYLAPIPVLMAIALLILYVPEHDKYLRNKYREQFVEWEKKTTRMFPFVY